MLPVATGESPVTKGSMNEEPSSVLMFELITDMLFDAGALTTGISFSELRDVLPFFISFLELFGFSLVRMQKLWA